MRHAVWFIFTILLSTSIYAQSYTYSYVDPCTKMLKSVTIPSGQANIQVTYYGTVGTFSQADFMNGTFNSWMNSVSSINSNKPCDAVATATTTTTNMIVTQNIIATLTNITSVSMMAADLSNNIANMTSSSVSNSLGNATSNASTGNSDNNKSNNGSNNSSGGSSGGSGSSTSGGSNGTSSSGSNGSGGSGGSGSAGGSGDPGSASGSGSSSSSNPGSTGSGSSGSGGSSNPGSSGSGSSGSNGSGSSGSGSGSSGSSGSGSSGSGSGGTGSSGSGSSGTPNSGDQGSTPPQEQGGSTTNKSGGNGGTANSVNNAAEASGDGGGSGGSGGGKGSAKTSAKVGSLIGTGDLVVIRNAEDKDKQDQFKFTMSMTHANSKNTFAKGFLGNFTTQINNSNVTFYGAWTKKNKTLIVDNSSMLNFDRDFFNTTTALTSFRYKKASGMFGLNATAGNLGQTRFVNVSAVGGGFFMFKPTKKITGTLLVLGVYSPFTQFYEGSWWESGLLLVPFSSWDYSITKKFKFNISISGVYQSSGNALNYQVLTGGKILL